MGSWGQPKESGTRHNKRIRQGGTWSEQDRRLNRHLHGRIRRKRGPDPQTWAAQRRHLEGTPPQWHRSRTDWWILAGLAAVTAVAAGGWVLTAAVVAVVAVAAWRRWQSRE